MRSMWTALVALALAIGAVLGAPPADAVAAPQPTPVASPAYPVRAERFSVSGRLTTRVARPVRLERLTGSGWTPVASGTTSRSGRYSLAGVSAWPVSTFRVVADKVRVGRKTYKRLVTRSRVIRTLAVVPSVPIVGERFTVSDRLPTKSSIVRPVALQRKVGRKWRTVVTGKTDATGTFLLAVPSAAKVMDLRVVAKKVRIKRKTRPQVVTKVARIIAVPQAGTISAPAQGTVDRPATMTLTFTPARPGRPARLEALSGGQWRTVGSGVLDASGRVSITTTPTGPGPTTYRGVAAAWNGAPSVATGLATMAVSPAVQPATGLVVNVGTQQGMLEPGGPGVTVPFTATNSGASPVQFAGIVDVAFVDVRGVAWSPRAGCAPQAYHASGSLTRRAGTVNPGERLTGVVRLSMDNLPTDQDTCKGVTVPLRVSVS